MSETVTENKVNGGAGALARKLSAAREGAGGIANSATLKVLRRSLARAAADLCELPLAVIAARQLNCSPEDLGRYLSDDKLLVVLDGPNGRIGAATLDAPTVTALIQQQTMGQVMGKAPTERHYTSTDAAMTADFIDRAFAKAVSMLEGQADLKLFEGFQFGARIEDVRSLLLGLEADDYRVIELTLDLSCGAMQGTITLILPEPTAAELGQDGSGGLESGPSLGNSMGAMRVELTAVLCRMKVPVSTFSSLRIGDVLPLDQAFLYETDLVSINGQSISGGRLGQINGARAVRLSDAGSHATGGAADSMAFTAETGAETAIEYSPEPPGMGLGIAAQTLQDPMDGLPMADMGELPMAGLGDLPMAGLGGLPMAGLDAGLGDLTDDMPALLGAGPMADLGDFDQNDALAEISELAGLPNMA
ncbi:FliM/FliN family flagellar motor switch protein [Parasedimentitalea psychrophila]|uniref:FliM/FliN family flagellar motor C-terminal domain-containing protein n=1 Tax=Parasedimentitalea psychrophila TaxID=2997337 RepID=A0A9Y2P2P2_9RHOB|nr:FliM/FliN family flagellar motor C-terminal domain-containing protein [Parasedimentitalea psychrophila]WIY25277.1 FliM/FliN family flagellar motor C-terminal domain-containing protein [Parasedimentitalea psychrophila]